MSSDPYPRSELGSVYTLAAGPTAVTPETLAALSRPVIYHYDPEFLDFYEKTVDLARPPSDHT